MFAVSTAAAEKLPEPTVPRPAPAEAPLSPVDQHIKTGRDLFQKKRYLDALKEFGAALVLKPEHRDARFLAGLCAYWARQPEAALEYWNALLDSAKRNSAEEWELEKNRVMALSALDPAGATEPASAAIERLYELRKEVKLPAAVAARGFVREHLHVNNLRAGCWEVFDDRGEIQDVWSFPVVVTLPAKAEPAPQEDLVRLLSVEAALMPGGTAGFALLEEGNGYKRVYKRWAQKPAYAEVRPLVLQALAGKLKPLEESAVENPGKFADVSKAAEAKPAAEKAPATPEAPVRVMKDREVAISKQVAALGLEAAVAQILSIAARLQDVEFDLTRLTRLSLTDPGLAERMIKELGAKAPYAQEDAAEFVDLFSKASAPHVAAFFTNLPKLGERKSYLDFVLLTAMNTRGRDFPPALLGEFARSGDFMVRQTASLILARKGERDGLKALFKDLEDADAPGAAILYVSLVELVGESIGTAPAADADKAALKKWKSAAAQWWDEHGEKIKFAAEPKPNEPFWK